MGLVQCGATHGHSIVLSKNPGVLEEKDVIYVPQCSQKWNPSYGLFKKDGSLITASGHFIGPQTHLATQNSNLTIDFPECSSYFDKQTFYIGPFTTHYGHFLVTTLCRIWASRTLDNSDYKYLYHGNEEPEELFQNGFVRDFFASLGLGPKDFIRFDSPTILKSVLIAYPGFQELSYGYQDFADFFLRMSSNHGQIDSCKITDKPIFLSKALIKHGVSGFLNENELVDALRQEDVEIVYPELMTLFEQISLFRSHKVIGGVYGSAFHTSLFSHKNNLLILNYENKVWTNQIIIDKLCRNETLYVYDDESRLLPKTGRYMNNFSLSDPAIIGKGLAQRLHNFKQVEASLQRTKFANTVRLNHEHGPEILTNQRGSVYNRYFRFSIVACARWETPYIVEWLNYYRAIGYDHVFLYCNDSSPTELYEKVLPFLEGSDPFVTFRYYPHQGQQLRMYAHFLSHDLSSSEWISFFDIDEYLRLPPNLTIADFVKKFEPDVDCVLFNWVFFGPDGHRDNPGSSILTEYRRRQNTLHPFTKYVARSKIFTGPKLMDVKEGHGFWHCPIDQIDQEIRVVNVLNEDMSNYYDGFPGKSTDYVNEPSRKERILATAVVHHYAFRTEKAFQDRVDRGLGGAFEGQVIWGKIASGDKFSEFLAGLNEVQDDSLASFWSNYLKRAEMTDVFDSPTRYTGSERSMSPTKQGPGSTAPVSRRKRATQSSVSKWSAHPSPDADAAGAVNGLIDGTGKFHTELEDHPWWQVDLSDLCGITEIRIFNRMEQPAVAERASKLVIEVGLQTDSLIEVYRRETDEPFGGIDGNPLIFKPTIPIPGRFVRIRLLTRNFLHLDQVEVYGEPLPNFTQIANDIARAEEP